MKRYNNGSQRKHETNDTEITPLEVKVDFPNDISALERAIKKLNRLIKKEGVFKEYMWRTYVRDKREKKSKYFDK